MILLNPSRLKTYGKDKGRHELMAKTVAWFEAKGLAQRMADDHAAQWYGDFIDFLKENQVYARLFTPKRLGGKKARWDTSQITEFGEILAFYGLPYWYTFQVSALGLGPVFLGDNDSKKSETISLLKDGAIFAFGLSEKEHGADIYASSMRLRRDGAGGYLAYGQKYYIGNANLAKQIAVFAKFDDSDQYVFFTVDSSHPQFLLEKNTVHSQNYVAAFSLKDYPVAESDILAVNNKAWDCALNTINIMKFNLGFASIGIATHAFYEALDHASSRHLFNSCVTDFPHVKALFVDALARLTAMKLFATRATDYMRNASKTDRRYLLYNPMVKMKVTSQGEQVINCLWDVIAAKGFEKDQYFSLAARDIRALPKLEGTVHVNMALIIKFMANYFFGSESFPEVPSMIHVDQNDDFLFEQGPTRGLGKIKFHDYKATYEASELANVVVFRKLIKRFKWLLVVAKPSKEQAKDFDLLLGFGELFTLVVYGQLILENAALLKVSDDLVDQIFDFMIRDFGQEAYKLQCKGNVTKVQKALLKTLMVSPVVDPQRFDRVFDNHVFILRHAYQPNLGDLSVFLEPAKAKLEAKFPPVKKKSPGKSKRTSTPLATDLT